MGGMDMMGIGMDPRIVKKGVEELKDQMKDLEREAYLIENNLERMQQERIMKN
jgi:hypothetical protein